MLATLRNRKRQTQDSNPRFTAPTEIRRKHRPQMDASDDFVTLSQARILPCSRSIPSTSRWKTAWPSASNRMQRNFGPLKQQVDEWRAMQLSTAAAKLLIYQAFIEEESGFPKHLARRVHDLYFQPVHEEFQARTMWSLSNAFTSAFKELEPIPQYKATAKLAGFLQSVRPQ